MSYLLKLILCSSVAAPASPATHDILPVPASYVDHILDHGMNTRAAVNLLRMNFVSKSDRAYLESLVPAAKQEDPVVQMKNYRQIADGYEITAPNGRAFTVTLIGGELAINKIKMELGISTAPKYLERVTAALKQTYVQNLWNQLDPLPKASASGLVTYMIIAAIAAGIAYRYRDWPVAGDKLIARNKRILETCLNDVTTASYPSSPTAGWMRLWKEQGILRADHSEVKESCPALVGRALAAYVRDNGKELPLSDYQKNALCESLRAAIKCGREFERSILVPVSTTNPAPKAGESTTGR